MISKTNPLFIKSDLLAKKIYTISLGFPKHELYGLTSQLRRAGLSVVLNIIEGFSRQSPNEYKHFLRIFYGSLQEVKYLLEFSKEQKYLSSEVFEDTFKVCEDVVKIIWTITYKN